MAALLLAYLLASFSYLQPEGLAFQLTNLLAATGIAAVSLHKRAFQPGVLNLAWAVIALVLVVRLLTR